MGVKNGGTRQLNDPPTGLLSKWLCRSKIPHMGGVLGYKRTCKGSFTEFAKRLHELGPNGPADAGALRYREGITAGLMTDATSADLSESSANAPISNARRYEIPSAREKMLCVHMDHRHPSRREITGPKQPPGCHTGGQAPRHGAWFSGGLDRANR